MATPEEVRVITDLITLKIGEHVRFNPYRWERSERPMKSWIVDIHRGDCTVQVHVTCDDGAPPTPDLIVATLIDECRAVLGAAADPRRFASLLKLPLESTQQQWEVGFLYRVAKRHADGLRDLLGDVTFKSIIEKQGQTSAQPPEPPKKSVVEAHVVETKPPTVETVKKTAWDDGLQF
jgi:hypothetical protein